MAKSNIEFLREIIQKNKFEQPASTEALEFLDAIEEELTESVDLIRSLKEEVSDKESEITKLEETIEELEDEDIGEEVFLGLDTIHYRLENGNLKIQIQFEHWCEQVKKQNAVAAS